MLLKPPRFGGAKSCTSMAPAQYQAHLQKHAVKILAAVTHSAQAAGVACEMIQVEHEHPTRRFRCGSIDEQRFDMSSFAEPKKSRSAKVA